MRKLDALAISLLLGGAGTAGAAAAMKTIHLGASVAATKPPRVADSVIAARAAKLDRWSAQLAHARAEKPPALPSIPRYAPVAIPTVPAALEAAPALAPAPPPVRHVVKRRVITVPAERRAATAPAPATAPTQPPAVQVAPAPAAAAPPAQTYQEGDDSGAWGGSDDGGGGGYGGDGGDD